MLAGTSSHSARSENMGWFDKEHRIREVWNLLHLRQLGGNLDLLSVLQIDDEQSTTISQEATFNVFNPAHGLIFESFAPSVR